MGDRKYGLSRFKAQLVYYSPGFVMSYATINSILLHCLLVMWPNSADNKLMIFSRKIGFDISGKLCPKETICMKCQSYFLGNHYENTSILI